jgi:glutathione S-transferase
LNRYLIEKYDKENRMMGGNDPVQRNRIRTFIHAAEGTFMLHALAITYARWFSPPIYALIPIPILILLLPF